MTPLAPSNNAGGRRRRRSTTSRRTSEALNEVAEHDGDGTWYLTNGSQPQRASFNPHATHDLVRGVFSWSISSS